MPVAKRPLRLVQLSDAHLGYRRFTRVTKSGFNQREVDVQVAFREAIDRTIMLRPDLVCICGDLFNSIRPSNASLAFGFRELRRLSAKLSVPILVCGGTQETPKRVDSGSPLRLLAEIEGVYVADTRAERFTFSELGISVQMLPAGALRGENLPEVRADDRLPLNILVAYREPDAAGRTRGLTGVNLHEWDYVALGGPHSAVSVALNAAASGSLERVSTNIWREAGEEKGILEVDLATGKRSFHGLTSPREVVDLGTSDVSTLEPAEIDGLIRERVDSIPGGYEGKLVRLELAGIGRQTYRSLDHRFLRELRSAMLNFTLEIRSREERQQPAEEASGRTGRRTLLDDLSVFCTSRPQDGTDPRELLSVLSSYYAQTERDDEAPKS